MTQSVDRERDEEWGIKLDESRVIKEFSYHYITSEKYDENQSISEKDYFRNSNFKAKTASSNQDLLNRQSYRHHSQKIQYFGQVNDVKTSTSPKQTESAKRESNMFQKISGKVQKKSSKGIIIAKGSTVRTYRRDNSKPPISKDKNIVIERRLVQSDSEALLYDTCSDVEDKLVFNREKPETSSDEERDEEVAAVLAKENNFPNAVFDSVKSPYKNCSSIDNLNISYKETGRDQVNSDICLSLINHEKNLSTSTDMNSDILEENYMPMTPRKKSSCAPKNEVLHSRSNSASHTLIIENLLGSSEESPYVEMTQSRPREISMASDSSFIQRKSDEKHEICDLNVDAERYCEIGKGKDMQYEMIYNASTLQEPLYMEVPSVKEKHDENSPFTLINESESILEFNKQKSMKENITQLKMTSRPSLPDILNTTAPAGSGRSDSSDADDEASKDLDSLDAPRHPRFSLSDTFRPASYYLGASLGDRAIIALNTEHQDSSDSDLVSPPPIPNSSPPLDDLETSMDSTIVNKESPTSNLNIESSNIYSNEMFLRADAKEFLSPYKMNKAVRNPNTNLYEASSEESVNYDSRQKRLKRRPLSADILSSLQDINFGMPTSNGELKTNNCSHETLVDTLNDRDHLDIDSEQLIKLHKLNNKDLEHFLSMTEEDLYNEQGHHECGSDMRYKSNTYIIREQIYSNRTSPIKIDLKSIQNQYENLPPGNSDCKYFIDKYTCKENRESFNEKYFGVKEATEINAHSNEQQNAPYYYSDLLKIDAKNFHEYDKNRWEEHISSDCERNSTSVGDKAFSKIPNYNQYNDSDSQKSMQGSNETFKEHKKPDGNSNMKKINNDSKNYFSYSSNKGCHTIRKNNNKMFLPQDVESPAPHRTRSLEGLIDNHVSGSINMSSHLFQINSCNSGKNQSEKSGREKRNTVTSKNEVEPNQDIWDEDTLWRENLRKVSIRHTRSLEDLDRKDGLQDSSSVNKVSGDSKAYENLKVTFVPENPNQAHKELRHCFSQNSARYQVERIPDGTENHETSKNIESECRKSNCEQKTLKEPPDVNNLSFEIDREKLRQWDLMSSAPAMLSSNRAIIKPITERKPNATSGSLPG